MAWHGLRSLLRLAGSRRVVPQIMCWPLKLEVGHRIFYIKISRSNQRSHDAVHAHLPADESLCKGCEVVTNWMMTRRTILFALFALQLSKSIAFTEMYSRISFMYPKNSRFDSNTYCAQQQLCSIRSHLQATTTGNNEGQDEEPSEINTSSDAVNNVSFSDTSPPQTTSPGPSNRIPGSSNPLIQGEVTMDGSLLVLVPAAVTAILGFIVSISIALNSPDEIVSSFDFKPRNEQSVPTDVCRGLCSSQEEDLNKLREFWKITD